MPRVYLETTIPSYLASRPSRDLFMLAHQELTRDWWELRRGRFELFVSDAVLLEAGRGDSTAAAERLACLKGIPVLEVTDEADTLSRELIIHVPLPARAAVDALHIAIAAINGMDYLLTWNCKHIANAALRKPIESTCRSFGVQAPIICTPEELKEL